MATRGHDPETRLVSARPEPAGESVAAALALEPGSPTLFLERLRLADGEPLLLEQVHLPAERFPGLLASDLEHESLYRHPHRAIRDAHPACPRDVRAGAAARGEARLLGRAACPGAAGRGHRVLGRRFAREFSRTYVRGDRTRYSVERIVSDEPSRDRHGTPRRPIGALTTVATNRALGHSPRAKREEVEPSRS